MSAHSRTASQESNGSFLALDTTASSFNNQLLTPIKSPIRQLGPLLLPKTRQQDQVIESQPKRAKRAMASSLEPSAKRAKFNGLDAPWAPTKGLGHSRSYSSPQVMPTYSGQGAFYSAVTPPYSRASSASCSPVTVMDHNIHQRRDSAPDLKALMKFSFPYREMPLFTSIEQNIPHMQHVSREPSPIRHEIVFEAPPTSSLMSYLTSLNPTPVVMDRVNQIRDPNAKHFWWDVRQIRSWTSFDTSTIASIPGLSAILNIGLPQALPEPPQYRTSQPESEAHLHNLCNKFYATKLNAALKIAQGSTHLKMTASQHPDRPSFVSNYVDDNTAMSYGEAHVVGLVKPYWTWNSTMRTMGNAQKVEYLRGLSHLHKHMRDYKCRYGFIMTETELVVVRNGVDSKPKFGYLEVQSIDLAKNVTEDEAAAMNEVEFDEEGNVIKKPMKMTALLALFYLHMLAKNRPLDGQPSFKSEIGAPAEGTRRICLPKDLCWPEPQLAEKRAAKRGRGWVWPEEPINRKELGKRGVAYSSHCKK
jgi:hypothetical protein